jgi:hypothetical protein
MSISIQTLHDTLIALTVTVGVAVALSIAFVAAAAFFERQKNRAGHAARPAAQMPQHPTQTDSPRELVLR